MKQIEMWKDVTGYDGSLQVSSQGRVRAIEQRYTLDTMKPITVCRLLNLVEMNQDYLGVHYDGKGFFIHMLVANAFNPNPDNKRLIIHKDRNKHRNWSDNLEWQTNSEVAKELIETGIMDKPPGYKGYIIECIETGEVYYGMRATAKKLECRLVDIENSVYGGKEIKGLHYKILHNYALQKQIRPDIFTKQKDSS